MKFSVIVPSYNQDRFIAHTLNNLLEIKTIAKEQGCEMEVLLFDSESKQHVQEIIEKYKSSIDFLEIRKDLGQYDAINKGIVKCTGDYWTWLNTDDLIDKEGFKKVIQALKNNQAIDYIYGSIQYITDNHLATKTVRAWTLDFKELVSSKPSIFQPGSWFRKAFTDRVGLLAPYQCCFDYDYICRLLQQQACVFCVNGVVAQFRYYSDSKSGSIMKKFVEEQWIISKRFGRKWMDPLSWTLAMRRVKHFLFS